MDIEGKVIDLRNAASLCSDENGDWWNLLADFYDQSSMATARLRKAIEQEIASEHKRLKRDFSEVTEEVVQRKVITRLRHFSELE